MNNDTIAAISTPPGKGAVSMIRVSGNDAIRICDRLFSGRSRLEDTAGHTLRYGSLCADGVCLDEVMCAVFHAPSSFTGENTVELYCHGGMKNTELILEALLSQGCRLADRGEFSKRAFLNGKIDLSQAEAIIDLINAEAKSSVLQSAGQLGGGISGQIDRIRNRLVEINAKILAVIDFPDEEIEEWEQEEFFRALEQTEREIDRLLDGYHTGQILKNGLKTLILGKTNVGKSSLLNCLLKEQKAIVTEVEGTTRDLIEETLEINGIPVRLIDTAGIRETQDAVEQIGVQRAKERIESCDLVLFVLDASRPSDRNDEEILSLLNGKQVLYLQNKSDLSVCLQTELPVLPISCKTGEGLDRVYEEIYRIATGERGITNEPLLNNLRHKQCLEQAKQSVRSALANRGLPMDVISIDLTDAASALGQITGREVGEETVAQIFSQFCVGK